MVNFKTLLNIIIIIVLISIFGTFFGWANMASSTDIKHTCTSSIQTEDGDIYNLFLTKENNTAELTICNSQHTCNNLMVTPKNIVELIMNIQLKITDEDFDKQFTKNTNCLINGQEIEQYNQPVYVLFMYGYSLGMFIFIMYTCSNCFSRQRNEE